MEVWKDIKGYEGVYQISDNGQVKSLKRLIHYGDGRPPYFKKEIILKSRLNDNGYEIVSLCKNSRYSICRVHRLIASAFISNPDEKPYINHINGVKNDNRIANLEWVTKSENTKHAYDNNLINIKRAKGEKHGCSKLTLSQVKEIKKMISQGKKVSRISRETKIKYNTIYSIKSGKTWAHVSI